MSQVTLHMLTNCQLAHTTGFTGLLYIYKMACCFGISTQAWEFALVERHGKEPSAPLSRQSGSLSCPRQGKDGLNIRLVAKLRAQLALLYCLRRTVEHNG